MVLFYKHLVRYIEKMTVFYNDVTATATATATAITTTTTTTTATATIVS